MTLLSLTQIPRTIIHHGRIVAPGDDPATVRELQTALARIGIDPGPIDGIVGWRTRLAHALAWVRYGEQRVGWWEDRRAVSRWMRQPERLIDSLDAHGADYVVLDVGRWDDDTRAWQAVAIPGEIGELMRHLRRHGIEPHVMAWPLADPGYITSMGRWMRELMDYARPESIMWDCEGTWRASHTDAGERALIALSRSLPTEIGVTTYPSAVRSMRRILSSCCSYLAAQYYEQVDPARGWDYPPGSLMPGMWGEPEGLDLWVGRAAYRQPSGAAAAESLTIAVETGHPRICYWSGGWVRRGGIVGDMLRRI